jgi:DNA-binding protein H-NS
MPAIILDGLSVQELIALKAQATAALAQAKDRNQAAFRSQVEALMSQFEISLEEMAALYDFKVRGNTRKTNRPAKYRNPDAPHQTWGGRGRQPRWLTTLLGQGRKLAEFKV